MHFRLLSCAALSLLCSPGAGAGTTAEAEVAHPRCRLFLAESTIPNAGLGIFTGVDLAAGDAVAEPDLVVPLADWDWHAAADADFHFLWNEYSWEPAACLMDGDMVEGSALVLGTGCMPNCNYALINAAEGMPAYDHAGLHRSRDAGTTGFTGFHGQRMFALRDVPRGGELFVDYGEAWFHTRAAEVGAVPLPGDFAGADRLLRTFRRVTLKYQDSDNPEFTKDLWDVVKTLANYDTRGSNALPLTFEDMRVAQAFSAAESRLPYSVRSPEWLAAHGRCMDNIRPGNSTVAQAGRGAFATRPILRGGLVAPGPLLHVANRTVLDLHPMGADGNRDARRVVGRQLLLNYCFGHAASSVLLCPYTSPSAYINHDGRAPNAKVVWAAASTPNHHPYWLDEDVDFLKRQNKIGLSIDFVATRDIRPGEEVFIDYGPEWEESWNKYVKEWSPPPDSENYTPASTLQNDLSIPLRTASEQLLDPYSHNIVFYCHYTLELELEAWAEEHSEEPWMWEDHWFEFPLCPCDILLRTTEPASGEFYYTVIMLDEAELDDSTKCGMEHYIPAGENHMITDVPRSAIDVRDRMYAKDEFTENSFRHEMMMPDEIFPEPWKNLQ